MNKLKVLTVFRMKVCFSKKLAIGCLTILLCSTFVLKGQGNANPGNQTSATEKDVITLKAIGSEKMDYERLSEIRGTISNRVTENFSFCLINYNGAKVYANNISAADGKFDEEIEEFVIYMPDKLPEAQYKLIIYTDSKNNQRKEDEKIRFTISL